MAVQFILGRSGTGKTWHCAGAIVESLLQKDDRPLLLLVPEQATYQASRAILNDARISGYSRLHVLSFDRLMFMVLGKNTARAEISRLGRAMVIQRILRDCSTKLSVFGGSAGPGLGIRLADTIARLQQYANGPEEVANLVGKLRKSHQAGDDLTTAKFADIGIIFERYIDFIKSRHSGIDQDIQLAEACKQVGKADFVKGAKLWVDGFAGFTAGELALLTELLKVVDDAHIALCLDPSTTDIANPDKTQIDPTDLFGPTVDDLHIRQDQIVTAHTRLAGNPRRHHHKVRTGNSIIANSVLDRNPAHVHVIAGDRGSFEQIKCLTLRH